MKLPFLCTVLSGAVVAQKSSAYGRVEKHPVLTTQKCTTSGGCVTQQTKVVLDANWRWLHQAVSPYKNCFQDPDWDPTLCPDPVTCAQNCALDGAQYVTDYGVNANGPNLTLLLYPNSYTTGSRVYLMSDDTHYQKIQLANQEVSFDVDVSGLPCGTNGALYFVDMDADGGQSRFPNNKAGAGYGTGYCDAQCRKDLHFVNGEANLLQWDRNARTGRYGSCCHEIDLWEANAADTAFTAHPCNVLGQTRCDGTTSSCSSTCDPSGCDFNTYRMGNQTFYGYGKTIDTNPGTIRVITQFRTSTGGAAGNITEIARFYIPRTPKGKVIANAASTVNGVSGNSLKDAYCTSEKVAFNEPNTFQTYGGFYSLTKGASIGMVLAMSVFVDYASGMRWLDSVFPDGASPTQPGALRGPCSTNTGDPSTLRSNYPNAQVTFSNIKWGDIGSTFGPPYP